MKLQDKVGKIKGVGEKKAALLKNLKIETVEDLLRFFPRRYEDRRSITTIMEAPEDKEVLVCGKLISKKQGSNIYGRKTPLRLTVQDNSANLEVVFFNSRYISGLFELGKEYTFYGKINIKSGRRQMVHPEFHKKGEKDDVRGIFPIYPLTEGLTQQTLRKLQREVIAAADQITEWLPEPIVKKYNLCSPSYAVRMIHFPEDERQIREARYRMVFEELLILETGLLYIKQGRNKAEQGISIDLNISVTDFTDKLPFRLTSGQQRVWQEIQKDMASGLPMNRLVQGDVGSGKTAVAELAMYKTVKAGFQAAMMAPTELLAKQHFASLRRDFEPFGVKVDLLCSSMKAKEKEQVLKSLQTGETDIIVGTHAIIQPSVVFKSLGLVITDEQHRFGVNQRTLLAEKGDNPNILVMTATPIPRTLAVILYGDLDISVIDTMPEGRRPIRTFLRDDKARDKIYDFVEGQIREGRQCYVVAPLIEESQTMDLKSAQELYEEISSKHPYIKVGLVHGAMKQEEKDKVMEAFASGDIDLLVSTVVIEVGINVPNATVMVIENCERFGLAQLHQLRGRVGRGKHQSYCILVCGHESQIANQRNEIMINTEDGFIIAEEDLKLRGPGEIFGTRQHGLPELNISDLVRHADILERTKDVAADILEEDPELLKNKTLRKQVKKMFGENIQLNL